jgi:hypothetical protein
MVSCRFLVRGLLVSTDSSRNVHEPVRHHLPCHTDIPMRPWHQGGVSVPQPVNAGKRHRNSMPLSKVDHSFVFVSD